MSDRRKVSIAIAAAMLLVLLSFADNLGFGTWLDGLREHGRRRDHYERVLKTKGLSLHEGAYWKKQE